MGRNAAIVLVLAAVPVTAVADDVTEGFCAILLAEETRDRESIVRNIEEAAAWRDAAERTYALLETLWAKEAVEKLRYLSFKHDRDVSVLREKRHRARLARQKSMLTQYEALCEQLTGSGSSPKETLSTAFENYTRALCEVHDFDLSIAEADRDYDVEFLASVRDLRKNATATELDVIYAERNLAMAEKRIKWARDRVASCRPGTTTVTGGE